MAAALIIPSTTPSTTTRASATPASTTAWRSRRSPAAAGSAWPRPPPRRPTKPTTPPTAAVAEADHLPLSFANYTDTVGRYVREVAKLAEDTRDEIAEKNRRITDGTYAAVSDPTESYVMPKAEAPAPFINFAPLQNALARLQSSTQKYQAAAVSPSGRAALARKETQAALDRVLMGFERAMTRDEGLPRRPWFKHQVYAPGFYTGYGVKTLPGVREAVEQHDWKEAEAQVTIAAATLERVAAEIERAAALLQGGS